MRCVEGASCENVDGAPTAAKKNSCRDKDLFVLNVHQTDLNSDAHERQDGPFQQQHRHLALSPAVLPP